MALALPVCVNHIAACRVGLPCRIAEGVADQVLTAVRLAVGLGNHRLGTLTIRAIIKLQTAGSNRLGRVCTLSILRYKGQLADLCVPHLTVLGRSIFRSAAQGSNGRLLL